MTYQQQPDHSSYTPAISPTGHTQPPLGLPWYGISLPKAFSRFFKKYATFNGRASRSEFWFAFLTTRILIPLAWLFIIVTLTALAGSESPSAVGGFGTFVVTIYNLILIVPSLAIETRRLHDSNHSGWWLLGYYICQLILGVILAGVFFSSLVDIAESYNYSLSYITPSDIAENIFEIFGGSFAFIIISLGLNIAFLVFMCLGPKFAGQRFDKPEDNPQFFVSQLRRSQASAQGQAQSYGQVFTQAPVYGQSQNQQPYNPYNQNSFPSQSPYSPYYNQAYSAQQAPQAGQEAPYGQAPAGQTADTSDAQQPYQPYQPGQADQTSENSHPDQNQSIPNQPDQNQPNPNQPGSDYTS